MQLRSLRPGVLKFARRASVAGFVFFGLKGLAWLTVPALIYWFRD